MKKLKLKDKEIEVRSLTPDEQKKLEKAKELLSKKPKKDNG